MTQQIRIKSKMTKSEIFGLAWQRAKAAALAAGTSSKGEFAAALRSVHADRAAKAARFASLATALGSTKSAPVAVVATNEIEALRLSLPTLRRTARAAAARRLAELQAA